MELIHWSENCACANRVAVATGHAWNVAPVASDLHRAVIGEQYFADSSLENELARSPKDIGARLVSKPFAQIQA
jgi:hypothetical protein